MLVQGGSMRALSPERSSSVWEHGHRVRAFTCLPCLLPPGKACALAYLMIFPLEWQSSEDVTEIMDHKSVLISGGEKRWVLGL